MGRGEGGPPAPPALHHDATPPVVPAETTSVSASISAVVEAEASEVAEPEAVEEELKPKRRKVKGTSKTRGRAKPKALRRECSRPEV